MSEIGSINTESYWVQHALNAAHEKEHQTRIYSGTTWDSFRSCAFSTHQVVVYDKGRDVGHKQRYGHTIYARPEMTIAARYAIEKAIEIGDKPVIISGNFPLKPDELQCGEIFSPALVIDEVWVLREGSPWKIDIRNDDDALVSELFQKLDPSQLLQEK